jgi:hypothetical protein
MMNEFEKTMEETFDIQVEQSAPIQEFKQAKKNSNVNDRDKDYEYVRGSLYDLIEKGQEAVNGALEIAQESGHPRAYEVAGNLIKQTTEMAEKLTDLHRKMKDLDEDKSGPKTVTNNNSMFIGSTSDLQKMLKSMGVKNK